MLILSCQFKHVELFSKRLQLFPAVCAGTGLKDIFGVVFVQNVPSADVDVECVSVYDLPGAGLELSL